MRVRLRQIFVEVNVVGCLNPIHPEVGGDAVDAELREDVVAQIPVERIFFGKMSQVFHESSIPEKVNGIRPQAILF